MGEGKKPLGAFSKGYNIGSKNGLTRQVNLRMTEEEMAYLEQMARKLGKSVMSTARAAFVLGVELGKGDPWALFEKAGVEPPVLKEDAGILGDEAASFEAGPKHVIPTPQADVPDVPMVCTKVDEAKGEVTYSTTASVPVVYEMPDEDAEILGRKKP